MAIPVTPVPVYCLVRRCLGKQNRGAVLKLPLAECPSRWLSGASNRNLETGYVDLNREETVWGHTERMEDPHGSGTR